MMIKVMGYELGCLSQSSPRNHGMAGNEAVATEDDAIAYGSKHLDLR